MRATVKRSLQLGTLAKDMARCRLQGGEAAAASMVERLGSLHGLPQKIGQILSLSELSDKERVFTPLTENRTVGLPSEVVFAELERRLSVKPDEYFRHIEQEVISASLGQVQRAFLHDGRQVAVKIQYPDIAESLHTDLHALGWLTAPVGGLSRGFDMAAYRREVGQMLQGELDYRKEARAIRTFSALAAGWEQIEIPEVIEELSGEGVLTMTWLRGEPFSLVREWPVEARRKLATVLLRLFLTSCFRWRYLHADPHPGNYRFRLEGDRVVLGLLDFGCMKELDETVVEALAALITDVMEDRLQDPDRVMRRYVAMGFNPELLAPMSDRLMGLTRVLFEPFRSKGAFSLDGWKLGERVAELLGPYRWNFRFAGPADLVFFMRAYQGLVRYLEALDAPVDWYAVLKEVGLPEESEVSEPAAVIERKGLQEERQVVKSKHLRIRIIEAERTKVDLTFGAAAAERLQDLVPEELVAKLRERSIDVVKIAKQAAARNFEPGQLFELNDGPKTVRVWLQ